MILIVDRKICYCMLATKQDLLYLFLFIYFIYIFSHFNYYHIHEITSVEYTHHLK